MVRSDLRNIAIIAHVDHGKTTLVDGMLRQSGVFRDNQEVTERVMDSGDIERERGITILAKNTSIHYNGVKINIVDTPGHADFGGEVERTLKMVNGVLLLVDAFEGPMPQTRFVLQHALALGLKVIVVVNKIDRPDARTEEIPDEVLELFMDLDATNEQLDSPFIYCSGRDGTATEDPTQMGTDLTPLFERILDYIPAPEGDENGELQMLVSSIDYNDYVGRIAVGRIERGSIHKNDEVVVCDYHGEKPNVKGKVANLFQFEALGKTVTPEANVGDIVAVSGLDGITIGETICAPTAIEPLPFVKISEPTIEMTFSVNDSPFAGREGKYVTSRQLKDRLYRELLKDVSLRVQDTDSTDSFRVMGRGEMHLSILIENMRREGYEFQVSTPRVLIKEIDGVRNEPYEKLIVDVPEAYLGAVMEKLGLRKGEVQGMEPVGSRIRAEFIIPSRGLFGYRSEFMTDTRGEGIMSSVFDCYKPMKGEIPQRQLGSLIAYETGVAAAYGIFNVQGRGTMFIDPGVDVYEGMVVGVAGRNEDIAVNVCKKKQASNMRAAGSDEALALKSPRHLNLEESMAFINDDELVEVTPKSIRIRKRILDNSQRLKQLFKNK